MTPTDLPESPDPRTFRRALAYLNGTTYGAIKCGARLLLTPYTTVKCWADGTNRVPGVAVAALRLLLASRNEMEE